MDGALKSKKKEEEEEEKKMRVPAVDFYVNMVKWWKKWRRGDSFVVPRNLDFFFPKFSLYAAI